MVLIKQIKQSRHALSICFYINNYNSRCMRLLIVIVFNTKLSLQTGDSKFNNAMDKNQLEAQLVIKKKTIGDGSFIISKLKSHQNKHLKTVSGKNFGHPL